MGLPEFWSIGDQIRWQEKERERLRRAVERQEMEAGARAPASASPTLRNRFSKEHWNLTEQMKLMKRDPERAKKLMADG